MMWFDFKVIYVAQADAEKAMSDRDGLQVACDLVVGDFGEVMGKLRNDRLSHPV